MRISDWSSDVCSSDLLNIKKEVDAELKVLEGVRQTCLKLADLHRDVANEETALSELTGQRRPLAADAVSCRAKLDKAVTDHNLWLSDIDNHKKTRPGFFSRLFRTERWTTLDRTIRRSGTSWSVLVELHGSSIIKKKS